MLPDELSLLLPHGFLVPRRQQRTRPNPQQAPVFCPKRRIRFAVSAAASSPMVLMPSFVSRSAAFGPMPLIFLAGSGQILVSMSSSLRIVMPSGFSRSEQIFDSSLLGEMPIEQVNPVAANTDVLIRSASGREGSSISVRSM